MFGNVIVGLSYASLNSGVPHSFWESRTITSNSTFPLAHPIIKNVTVANKTSTHAMPYWSTDILFFEINHTIHKDHIAITDKCGYTKISKQISE